MVDEGQRPDPDRLLAEVTAEREKAARGRLKIFFGACPGVGKTYAMLTEATRLREQGLDVAVAIVETHGRVDTAALTQGLEILHRRSVVHQGRPLEEMDLEAVLRRRPALVLVDELAHSNAPGSPHPKRWQDVEELLAAGINVYTTLNVQHLESLNDIVGRITGIQVRETLPDHVFDEADEIMLVDLPPDDLLQRLKAGQVYMGEQVERAAGNFFRKGNLMALRELALRRTAERVDHAMRAYRQKQPGAEVWPADESLLVCIGPQPGMDTLVRSCARLATQLNARWHALSLETPELQSLSEQDRKTIHDALHLAETLGAETAIQTAQSAAEGTIRYARQHNLSRVVLGRRRGGPGRWWRRSLADRIATEAPDLDIVWISRGKETLSSAPKAKDAARVVWRPYLLAMLIPAVTTVLAMPVFRLFDIANIVMLFLVGVVAAAMRWGRGPAALVAVLNVAAFDFFFVQPRFSFAVTDVQYLFMFAVMLLVGLVIGQLTARLRFQAESAGLREQRATALYEMAREMSSTLTDDSVAEIATRHLSRVLQARAALYLLDLSDQLVLIHQDANPIATDDAIARWVLDHTEPAGWGTDTLPATPQLYMPLRAPMRTRGVLVIDSEQPENLRNPEQYRLLETFAALTAMAFERVHFVTVAQQTLVNIESERLRNTLLAALSHDLRTPLTTLVGISESMALDPALTSPALQAQAKTLAMQARGMARLVHNLLDMARLQSGELQLKPDWHSFEELAGSSLALIRRQLGEREVRLNLDPDLPLVWCDGILMERVLVNLLENAAKYTPVDASLGLDAWVEGESVCWRVWDNGPGFRVENPESLFGKFVRGQPESAVSGVGLGLAICRAILQAHGGSIRAFAHLPSGAAFECRVPRKEPPVFELECPAEPGQDK